MLKKNFFQRITFIFETTPFHVYVKNRQTDRREISDRQPKAKRVQTIKRDIRQTDKRVTIFYFIVASKE